MAHWRAAIEQQTQTRHRLSSALGVRQAGESTVEVDVERPEPV